MKAISRVYADFRIHSYYQLEAQVCGQIRREVWGQVWHIVHQVWGQVREQINECI